MLRTIEKDIEITESGYSSRIECTKGKTESVFLNYRNGGEKTIQGIVNNGWNKTLGMNGSELEKGYLKTLSITGGTTGISERGSSRCWLNLCAVHGDT
jgi:hypothetical protein